MVFLFDHNIRLDNTIIHTIKKVCLQVLRSACQCQTK